MALGANLTGYSLTKKALIVLLRTCLDKFQCTGEKLPPDQTLVTQWSDQRSTY